MLTCFCGGPVKTYLEIALPSSNLDFLMSEINQSDTFLSLEVRMPFPELGTPQIFRNNVLGLTRQILGPGSHKNVLERWGDSRQPFSAKTDPQQRFLATCHDINLRVCIFFANPPPLGLCPSGQPECMLGGGSNMRKRNRGWSCRNIFLMLRTWYNVKYGFQPDSRKKKHFNLFLLFSIHIISFHNKKFHFTLKLNKQSWL